MSHRISGVARISQEREHQINEKGFGADRDEQYVRGELARAAVCYALPRRLREASPIQRAPSLWPWGADSWKPSPGDRVRELAKAGALIAAEIDRLQDYAQKHE